MKINPFKDANLNDLQHNISNFFIDHFENKRLKIKTFWKRFKDKGNERITVMFIPHSEKKIVNFHVSIFTISSIAAFIIITVLVTSILIINHSSTVKEISILKRGETDSKELRKIYKEEIVTLQTIFEDGFKPVLDDVYNLSTGSGKNTLWAKGGADNPNPNTDQADSDSDENTENNENNETDDEAKEAKDFATKLLYMQEVKHELEITKDVIGKFKNFLNYRKIIIENTPSIWPVDGYIVSQYVEKKSPYSLKRENHKGIDIETFPCAEIRATAPGNVHEIKWNPTLGLTVSIRHRFGFTTSYSHCQRVSVEVGQKVLKGETIGYTGKTGSAAEYMCFYQIKIGTEYVNPMPFLNRISK
ncbi:MAG: M23 family metallopeptidase [Leptospirales bacterium]|nr:M23 family metallopeptidase [Leptospirales bacterium]